MSQVAERVNNVSPHAARYIADYHGAASSSQPAWLTNLRESAIASFERLGFPTTRLEQWRFTSVTPISEKPFALATGGLASADAGLNASPTGGAGVPGCRNGRFRPAPFPVDRLPQAGSPR